MKEKKSILSNIVGILGIICYTGLLILWVTTDFVDETTTNDLIMYCLLIIIGTREL